jgi:hypothetical protein
LGGAFQPTFTGGSGVGYDFAEFIENEAELDGQTIKIGCGRFLGEPTAPVGKEQ